MAKDWTAWHDGYEEPGSLLARRLPVVQAQVRMVLTRARPGPLRMLTLCAGQGRDLLDVLATHPRRPDVTAHLVEFDPVIAEEARRRAGDLGLDGVSVLVGDAADTDLYRSRLPADIVMLCGIFGNVSADDVKRTVSHCSGLCAAGGHVIWTRHRRPPDLVPHLCAWFEDGGFTPVWVSESDRPYGVGVHRFEGPSRPLPPGAHLFTFTPDKR